MATHYTPPPPAEDEELAKLLGETDNVWNQFTDLQANTEAEQSNIMREVEALNGSKSDDEDPLPAAPSQPQSKVPAKVPSIDVPEEDDFCAADAIPDLRSGSGCGTSDRNPDSGLVANVEETKVDEPKMMTAVVEDYVPPSGYQSGPQQAGRVNGSVAPPPAPGPAIARARAGSSHSQAYGTNYQTGQYEDLSAGGVSYMDLNRTPGTPLSPQPVFESGGNQVGGGQVSGPSGRGGGNGNVANSNATNGAPVQSSTGSAQQYFPQQAHQPQAAQQHQPQPGYHQQPHRQGHAQQSPDPHSNAPVPGAPRGAVPYGAALVEPGASPVVPDNSVVQGQKKGMVRSRSKSLLDEQGVSPVGKERFWQRGHFLIDCDEVPSTSAFDVYFLQGDDVFVRADEDPNLWQVKLPHGSDREYVAVPKNAVCLGGLKETPAEEKKRIKANKRKIAARDKLKKKEAKAAEKARKAGDKPREAPVTPGKVQIPPTFQKDSGSGKTSSATGGSQGGNGTQGTTGPASAPPPQDYGDRTVVIRKEVVPPSVSPMNEEMTEERLRKLNDLVCDSDMLLYKALSKVLDKDNIKRLTHAWVHVLNVTPRTEGPPQRPPALDHLDAYVRTDVRYAAAAGNKALHRDALSTRCVMAFAHAHAMSVFKEVVSGLMTSMRTTYPGSYEVNMDKLKNKEDYERNMAALFGAFDAFISSCEQITTRIPETCDVLKMVQQHAGAEQPHIGGDFFFCRFLQPVMMDPMRYGVVHEKLSSEERRNIQWVCRLMISMSTHVKFDDVDETYRRLNEYVASRVKRLDAITESLLKSPQGAQYNPGAIFPHAELLIVHTVISQNMEKIKNNATGVGMKRFDMRAFNNGVKLMTALQGVYPNV